MASRTAFNLILLLAAGSGVALLFYYLPYLSLERLQESYAALQGMQDASPWLFGAAYTLVFLITCSLGLPLNALLMLYAGAAFSLPVAIGLVLFCRVVGDTNAFLLIRHVFAARVQQRYPVQLERLRCGFARDGMLYLLLMRLVPVVPSVLTNAGMALAGISLTAFVLGSALGVMPWIVMFTLAGQELTKMTALSDAVQPEIIVLLSAMAVSMIVARRWRRLSDVSAS